MTSTLALPATIECYFDPGCPWTWMTSRWLVDAAARREVGIVWRSLGLAVLNEGEVPPQFRTRIEASRSAHRVFAALRSADRNDDVGALYTELGARWFHDGEDPSLGGVRKVVAAVGLADVADAVDDADRDAEVEASTAEAVDLAGPDVGSPVLAFDHPKVGIFGPIVSPPPSGEEAARLLDLVVAAARTTELFELKRGRSAPPQFGPRP